MSSLSSGDPWNTTRTIPTSGYQYDQVEESVDGQDQAETVGPRSIQEDALEMARQLVSDWEKVSVNPESEAQGSWLGHYYVYQITLVVSLP